MQVSDCNFDPNSAMLLFTVQPKNAFLKAFIKPSTGITCQLDIPDAHCIG